MLAAKKGTVVHCVGGKNPFTEEEIKDFKLIGCNFEYHIENTASVENGIIIS